MYQSAIENRGRFFIPGPTSFSFLAWPGSPLPTNPFNVIVHADGEFVAATSAAALEDFATISGSHASPEAVHAQAAVNLRLISPLRRH